MGTIRFEWLANGEPFQVPPMPLAGHQEVNQLKLERIQTLSEYRRLLFYSQAGTMLGIWRMYEKHGEEPAKKAWNQAINVLVHPLIKQELDWEDNWAESFEAWINDRILPQLEVPGIEDDGVDEGLEKVQQEMDEFGDESKVQSLMLDASEMDQDAFIKEVWWRLQSKFSKITVPLPEDADEDAEPTVLPLTEENLKQVISYPEDQLKWHQALGKDEDVSDKVKGKLMEDAVTLKSEEELLGNS